MNQTAYLRKIAIARSTRSFRSSADAYAQMDRMAKSTNGLYESFRRIAAWAKDEECFYPALKALKEGGREHDLTYEARTDSWLKFTKPAAAGYIVTFDGGAPALELPITGYLIGS